MMRFQETFSECNAIDVLVISTGYMGGDAGHGGKTIIQIADAHSTNMQIGVNGTIRTPKEFENWVEIVLRGDSELCTAAIAFRFIADTLDVVRSTNYAASPDDRQP